MRFLPLLAALVVSLSALPAAPAAAADPGRVLRLVNRQRTLHGLATLRADRRLARAARGHSRDMVRRRYFAHASPEGEHVAGRVRRTGWLNGRRSWWLGEDLAWGIGRPGTSAGVVRAWMRSPEHRRILLGRVYRSVGIGVAAGTPVDRARGATVTADFGA
jgi:uncharacterized protein YkwD